MSASSAAAVRRRSRLVIAGRVTGLIVTLLVLLVYVAPIVWMMLTSFKPADEILSQTFDVIPSRLDVTAYVQIVTTGFLTYIRNSFVVSAVATLATTMLALLAAYGFSRFRFRGSRVSMIAIVLSQLVPFVVLVTPIYVIYVRLGLANTSIGLIIAYTAVGLPYAIYMLLGYMNTVPISLDEAARIDGSGPLGTLFRVIMPVSWPGVVTVAVYAFTRNWEEYLLATSLISADELKTLPVGLAGLFGEFTTQWNLVMAAATVSTLPTMIVFLVLQRQLIGNLTSGAVK
ncbi:MAG: carbohydrate ABC transporter permease [Propionicimonas sp.]